MPTKTTTTTMSQTSPSGTESLALILYRLDEMAVSLKSIQTDLLRRYEIGRSQSADWIYANGTYEAA